MQQSSFQVGREEILYMVKDIVLKGLGNAEARVYLFGSWARGEEKRASDIDIAIEYEGSLAHDIIVKIRELLEESRIPYRVDVVDLTKAGPVLAERVKEEGILWKGYAKD